MINRNDFINKVSNAIIKNELSYFIGAGVSKGAGYLDWRELLADFAKELNLDINKEHDLIELTQFYFNKNKRHAINQKIKDEFESIDRKSEDLNLLCELPVKSVWTTNFDKLIETHYEKLNKIIDVKLTKEDLTTNRINADVTLYKMHGDVTSPSKAIITRDDYERFDKERSLFTKKLIGELVTNTFLFVGYSFSDPNLHSILSKIRKELNSDTRPHYYITKYEEDEYKLLKQNLIIQDLSRYNIITYRVKCFSEITSILKDIRDEVYKRNIFISGSAYSYDEFNTIEESRKLIKTIVESLILNNYKIVNGLGLGIGDSVVQGIISGLSKKKHVENDPFDLKVFPQKGANNLTPKELWTSLRRNMISKSRIAIFMFGNKLEDGKTVFANGMEEEFRIAQEYGLKIIPIVSTGYITKELYEKNKESCSVSESFKDKNIEKITSDLINIISK